MIQHNIILKSKQFLSENNTKNNILWTGKESKCILLINRKLILFLFYP